MYGIIWRTSPDKEKHGLEEMTKIVTSYWANGIGVVNISHACSSMRIKNEFANGDIWELLPAEDGEIRGRRYNVALIASSLKDYKDKEIIESAKNSTPFFAYNYY